MKNLALIPARSGSKGLPDKNIKPLCGIPLLGRTILCAKESGCFDEIYVSTDSLLYADIAREYGAQVPFLRSEEAASDTASSYQVIVEAMQRYEEIGKTFDTLTLLQPTSPLRNAEDIQNVYAIMAQADADVVVAMCEVDHSPLWTNTLPADKNLANFLRPEILNQPRQNLDTYYRINGACYTCKIPAFLKTGSWYGPKSYAYVMPQERSIDIDTEIDFRIAEAILDFNTKKRASDLSSRFVNRNEV